MKILVLNGSPRKKGNCETLIHAATTPLKAQGADVVIANLSEMKIAGCRGCETCVDQGIDCIIEDDMQQLYEHVKTADGFIFATPVYWFSMSSYLKVFWDRLFGPYANDETFMKEKFASIIITHGDDDTMASGAANAYRSLSDAFTFSGGSIVTCMTAFCNDLGEISGDERAMDTAKKLGLTLAEKIVEESKEE